MKNKYLYMFILILPFPFIKSMEPVKIEPSREHIQSSRAEVLRRIIFQMLDEIPMLNDLQPHSRYDLILRYFQTYAQKFQAIDALLETHNALRFNPGANNAQLIKNKGFGCYLYEMARANNQQHAMQWLIENQLCKEDNRFFNTLLGLSLGRISNMDFRAQPELKAKDAEFWLSLGAQINRQDAQGVTMLMRRARLADNSEFNQTEFLLSHGADPNLQDINGNTALHEAAGNPLKTALLIKYGANPNIRNKQGKTAQDLRKK